MLIPIFACRRYLYRSASVSNWKVLTKTTKFPPGLDDLYGRMLMLIRKSDDDVENLCKKVLATTVHRPLMLKELTCLVNPLQSTVSPIP
jgi:hypothetical protein